MRSFLRIQITYYIYVTLIDYNQNVIGYGLGSTVLGCIRPILRLSKTKYANYIDRF